MQRSTRLRRFALSGMAIGAAVLLTAGLTSCTSSSKSGDQATGTPVSGGVATIGMASGGATDTLDPGLALSTADQARAQNLYSALTRPVPVKGGTPDFKPLLATSVDRVAPDEFNIKLRDDIKYSDGSAVTLADYVYGMKRVLDPKNGLGVTSFFAGYLTPESVTVTGKWSVKVKLDKPQNDTHEFMGWLSAMFVMKDGTTDFSTPLGTGPFMLKSFTPGEQTVLVRNPHYFEKGKPYLDSLVIRSLPDASARVNAFLTGQIDAAETPDIAQVRQYANDSRATVLVTPGNTTIPFYMRIDVAPFKDVRVRQAMKLLVDRKQMVDVAYQGYGQVGNDVFGVGQAGYDPSLKPVVRDVKKAKQLLKDAGYPNGFDVTLVTAKAAPGMTEAAAVLVKNAAEAGVRITLKEVPAGDIFNSDTGYLTFDFGETSTAGTFVGNLQVLMGPDASYNETHDTAVKWKDALSAVGAAPNPKAVDKILFPLEKTFQQESGYIVWGFSSTTDFFSPKLKGVVPMGYSYGMGDYQAVGWWLKK